jgi:hypothetical protein
MTGVPMKAKDAGAGGLASCLDTILLLGRILSRTSSRITGPGFGHTRLDQFNQNDLTTWKREMADLTGIKYAGVGWSSAE